MEKIFKTIRLIFFELLQNNNNRCYTFQYSISSTFELQTSSKNELNLMSKLFFIRKMQEKASITF